MAIESRSSIDTPSLEALQETNCPAASLSLSPFLAAIAQHMHCCSHCIPVGTTGRDSNPSGISPSRRLLRSLPAHAFPSPLHTWVNLLRFAGIPWKERWRLASWVEQLWEGEAELPADLEQRTADDWLASIGQSAQTCRVVWNPLAQWLTGNDLATMSADAFLRSIKPVFLSTYPDSRVSVVQDSLLTRLIQPITEVLIQGNAAILHNTDATQLRYERDRISGVLLRNGSLLQADWYVAALPPSNSLPYFQSDG